MAVVLQKVRHDFGKTQSNVSKDLGITIKYVSAIENGRIPGGKMMKKIADYFGRTIDEIFFAEASNEVKS